MKRTKISNVKLAKQSGITLIALVITIIVLLILAGVTITTLTGDNGLLKKTEEAIKENTEGEIKEQIRLIANEMKIQQVVSGENQENALRNILQSKDPNATVTKLENSSIYEVFYNGSKFLINTDLDYIPIVEPQNVSDWNYTNAGVINGYMGSDTNITIPNYINGVRITKINSIGYIASNYTIKISEGIEIIGASAFRGSNITGDVIIPDSVTEIENYAFQYCNSLNGTLKLGKNLRIIGNGVFQTSKLTGDLIIPDKVETIGISAFKASFNGKIKLGNNLKTIGDYAFDQLSNLTGDLIIPDSVTNIGISAFNNCNKLNGTFKLGKNVKRIEETAFADCSGLLTINDFVIPESVSYIGKDAFSKASKEITILNRNVEIYNSVKTLGNPSKIIGYAVSTAKSYADTYERTFVALDN